MIRSPDEYRTETLVQLNPDIQNKNNLSYDEQIKITLEISKQDFSDEMQVLDEQHVLMMYQEQMKKRENEISGILLKYKKVSHYDKEFKELLPILETVFDSYVKGYTEYCCFDNETGKKIMKHLQQIRLNEEERNILLNIKII
jgi:hypothetical protein